MGRFSPRESREHFFRRRPLRKQPDRGSLSTRPLRPWPGHFWRSIWRLSRPTISFIADRLEWSHRVSIGLNNVLRPRDSVVFLAGQKYREFLEPSVLALRCQFSVPMQGMRIGEQLKWLGNSEEF